jgi:hypothetical protein
MRVVMDEIIQNVAEEYAALDQFDQDSRFIDQHYDELWGEHPEEWIAVYRGEVVSVARDIETLIKELDDKAIRPEDAARRKLTKLELLI